MHNEIQNNKKIIHQLRIKRNSSPKKLNNKSKFKKIQSKLRKIKEESVTGELEYKKNNSNPIKKTNIINSENPSNKINNIYNIKLISFKPKIEIKNERNFNLFINSSKNNFQVSNPKLKIINNQGFQLYSSKSNIDDFDELPYSMALKLDNRTIYRMFFKKLLEKFEIIDILINREIKSLLLSKYFLFLLIDFWLNAFLYSDDVVSHKSHNDGKLEFIVVLAITLSSKIFSSIIQYFLNKLIFFEEKSRLIKEIKREFIFLRILNKFLKEILIKTLIFMFIEILIIFFCLYYLIIFCTIYSKSQISLVTNYLMSFVESFIISVSLAVIIITSRKIGLFYNNKYIYNFSKYVDNNF